jgi:threonine dehydratase
MKLFLEEERLIVEPAGVVGVAALVEHPGLREYSCVGTVVCGSNMTGEQIRTWLLGGS